MSCSAEFAPPRELLSSSWIHSSWPLALCAWKTRVEEVPNRSLVCVLVGFEESATAAQLLEP
ncbi:hypothetical protein ABH926_004622 [Catenulispora sp. GP43]|uniref:hypothetical protein n=1 Tax=Catenulispora sp. GP43 TaxID=3156263 RepID=UPI003517CEAD